MKYVKYLCHFVNIVIQNTTLSLQLFDLSSQEKVILKLIKYFKVNTKHFILYCSDLLITWLIKRCHIE